MKEWIDSLMREWERTLLGVMIAITMIGLGTGIFTYIGFFSKKGDVAAVNVTVSESIHDKALAFLNSKPAQRLGSNHAMRLQVPRDWIDNMEYKAFLAKRNRDNKDKEAQRLKKIAWDEQRKRILEERKNVKGPTKTDAAAAAPATPPPPITHVLVFKGFMRAPSGEMLAYMGLEDIQGDAKERKGAQFIRPGAMIHNYKISEVNDEFVTLIDPKGGEVTVIRGQRMTMGITQNPGRLIGNQSGKAAPTGKRSNKKGGTPKGTPPA